MTHYICTGGCGGVSESSGVCQAMNCPKHNQPLEACDCTDNQHYGKTKEAYKFEDLKLKEQIEKKWWQFWK